MPHCGICKKPLTVEESIHRGIGPVCLLKMKQQIDKYDEANGDTQYTEFTGDVVLERAGNQRRINIPRIVVRHSPTGLEWGYGGSGPADLALNILTHFEDINFANQHYQDFKWQFIVTMPKEGGVIKGKTIREWIAARKADLFHTAEEILDQTTGKG